MVIHNAASLGDLTKKSSELNDQEQWIDYLQTNLISTIYLNNLIYSVFNKEVNIFQILILISGHNLYH